MSTTESSIPSPSKGSSPPCLIRYCGNFRGCIPPGHEGVMRSGGWCLRGQESGGGTGKRGGGKGVRECIQFVHGRSRMTVDPRILTMPGRSTSAFPLPGRHCLHQARSAVRCSASRMKGELHPSKNRSSDGLRHLVPTCSWMTAPTSYFVFWCDHSRDSNGYYYVLRSICLVVAYHIHTT